MYFYRNSTRSQTSIHPSSPSLSPEPIPAQMQDTMYMNTVYYFPQ